MIRHFMLGGVEVKDRHAFSGIAEVDLHLDETTTASPQADDTEKLLVQLDHLNRQLDQALAAGCSRLIVIHGKGKNRLREAVYRTLEGHPHIKNMRLLTDRKYHGGATEITFK
ncbi:MAG: hypothetical protein KatS3mg031_1418 [Chitinophagales bacterium]|nr:MAG: hypothetical protein KatS3mg031_1418 [Chitinophagales bacterium]